MSHRSQRRWRAAARARRAAAPAARRRTTAHRRRRPRRRARAKPHRSTSRANGSRSSTRTGAGAWSRRRKATYASVPLNDEGRRVADQWDPATGRRVRRVRRRRAAAHADAAAHSLGRRRAARDRDRCRPADTPSRLRRAGGRRARARCKGSRRPSGSHRRDRRAGLGSPAPAAAPRGAGGYLDVKTTNLLPAGCAATACRTARTPCVTEYFARFAAPNGDEWLMVTTIVDDPRYLTQRFVTSSHFRRETEGGKWNPQACGAAS